MAAVDHRAGLERAGANVSGLWSTLAFHACRYPLGARRDPSARIRVIAVFAPWITDFDPTTTNPRASLAHPGDAHWLGADFMGRDVYSRIVYGARISLAVGAGSTLLGCFFVVMIGLASGYVGGWFDLVSQRLIDIMQALPLLVLALIMAASLGPSLENTIIAISIPLVPQVARVIRSNTLPLAKCHLLRRRRQWA